MNKTGITGLLLLLFTICNAQSFWTDLRSMPVNERSETAMDYLPTSYRKLKLDYNDLVKGLQNSPAEFGGERSTNFISLPLPNGQNVEIMTFETRIMEEGLSRKYPSIKAYRGWSNDGLYTARFEVGPTGFHGAISTPDGDVYIDPYFKNENQYYLCYFTSNSSEPKELQMACGVKHEEIKERALPNFNARSAIVNLHEYRFAMACTGEWGAVRGTKEKALADMVTITSRVNLIYERDLASRVVLIADNDKLIHLNGETDPYTSPTVGQTLLPQNTTVVNNLLGSAALYDIGHIVTVRCSDVGGVANYSVCSGIKANGVSCQSGSAISVGFILLVAHEMGHQFHASHSFNVCDAETQNAGSLGFEPGSGSTIMSYAGACGTNNIAGGNDDYYHNSSLSQMYTQLRNNGGAGFNCAKKITINNSSPEVEILTRRSGLIIPKGTPFVLEGKATDADGDRMTYVWEQKDASETLCPLGSPTGECPSFRSIRPDTFPYRFFPASQFILTDVVNKQEVLPNYSRTMNFSFTARDNNTKGGVASWDQLTMRVDEQAGSFKVTWPAETGLSIPAGSQVEVTWDVANTDKSTVGAKFVDIYLSKRNAMITTSPNLVLLAQNVPNTGKYLLQLDGSVETNLRILVRGSGNAFFNISKNRFATTEATKPTAFISTSKNFEKLCGPAKSSSTISSKAIAGFSGNLNFVAGDLPAGFKLAFSKVSEKVGVDVNMEVNIDNTVKTGSYGIPYSIIMDSGDTLRKTYFVDVTSTDFSDLKALLPLNNEQDAELPTFTWTPSVNGINYELQVSKDPSFEIIDLIKVTDEAIFKPVKTFDKKSIYFWRLRAINDCTSGPWSSVSSFGTLIQDCKVYSPESGLPLNISAGGPSTVISKINVPTGRNISDINVTKLKIRHDNFKDLTGALISPANKRVVLWDGICEKVLNIEVLVDDQAPVVFGCNNTATGQYRPKESLSLFNGDDATGVWTLEIKDNKSGSGGRLDSFKMEVCASISLAAPTLVNDKRLEVKPLETGVITNTLLKASDSNGDNAQIFFTVVTLPAQGNIILDGKVLRVKDRFTQQDIDSGKLTFKSTNNQIPFNDKFRYLVRDSEGGWFGVKDFNILINDPSSTSQDPIVENAIKVYPNPANTFVNIAREEEAYKYNSLTIYNAVGQAVKRMELNEKVTTLDIADFNVGVYFMEFNNSVNRVTKRLIIAK